MMRVLVWVSGGLVQQVTHDDGVEVHVFDEDNLDDEPEDFFNKVPDRFAGLCAGQGLPLVSGGVS